MTRKLLIVFVSGLVLSIVSLSAAWAIGGKEMIARGAFDFGDGDGDRRGPTVTRQLAFDRTQILKIDTPVSLTFTRGPATSMTVSGPARSIEAMHWHDGELSMDRGGRWWRHGGLTVTITAPQIAGLSLHGPGHIELRDLDQPSLKLETRGPADIDATGKVTALDIDSRGVGSLDLGKVDAVDAKVSVRGVGDVDINASGTVDASLRGVGNVTLHRKPARLDAETHGVGGIHRDYDDERDSRP